MSKKSSQKLLANAFHADMELYDVAFYEKWLKEMLLKYEDEQTLALELIKKREIDGLRTRLYQTEPDVPVLRDDEATREFIFLRDYIARSQVNDRESLTHGQVGYAVRDAGIRLTYHSLRAQKYSQTDAIYKICRDIEKDENRENLSDTAVKKIIEKRFTEAVKQALEKHFKEFHGHVNQLAEMFSRIYK